MRAESGMLMGLGLLLALLLAMNLGGCGADRSLAGLGGANRAVSIVRHRSGSDPCLKQPGSWLIRSQEQLESKGCGHLMGQSIDFGRYSVVILALGEQPTDGYWGRVTGLQSRDGVVYMQGVANRPDAGRAVAQQLTYPYDAVVVPRLPDGELRLEVDSVSGSTPPGAGTPSLPSS